MAACFEATLALGALLGVGALRLGGEGVCSKFVIRPLLRYYDETRAGAASATSNVTCCPNTWPTYRMEGALPLHWDNPDKQNSTINCQLTKPQVSELLRELSELASGDDPTANPPIINKASILCTHASCSYTLSYCTLTMSCDAQCTQVDSGAVGVPSPVPLCVFRFACTHFDWLWLCRRCARDIVSVLCAGCGVQQLGPAAAAGGRSLGGELALFFTAGSTHNSHHQ